MARKEKIILDTRILIEILRGNHTIIDKVNAWSNGELFITPVVVAEIFRGASDKEDLRKCKKLLDKFTILPLNEPVIKVFMGIFERYAISHRPSIPDALIASVAVYFDFSFYTLNKRDFQYIKELKLI